MPKINFLKVEAALDEALRNMSNQEILELATFKSLLKTSKKSEKNTLMTLIEDLKTLKIKQPDLYQKLEITPSEEDSLYNHPETLTQEDWKRLKLIQQKIEEFTHEIKKEHAAPIEESEKIIEEEKKKHETKRFNVRDNWYPL